MFNQETYLAEKRAAVESARDALEEAKSQLAVAEAELHTAEELLAQLAPKLARRRSSSSGGARRGRKPGAISSEWRNVLYDLHDEYPNGFSVDDVREVAEGLHEMKIRRPSDITRKLEAYENAGYVVLDGESYKVTAQAVSHLDFATMRAERSSARTENEAPNDRASEAEADGGTNTTGAPEFQPNPSW